MKKEFKNKCKKAVAFVLNPRLLLCFGIAWLITNGWSYILFAVGTACRIPWMVAVASAYLAFLWLPISPEKLVTVAIAIALLRFLFPKDEKTLAVCVQMLESVKRKIKEKKKNKKRRDASAKADERAPDEKD